MVQDPTVTIDHHKEAPMKNLIYSSLPILLVLFFIGCGGDADQPPPMDADTTAMDMSGMDMEGDTLSAVLTGGAEVPEPGDPDGSGTAEVVLNPADNTVCFDIEVENIEEPGAAHIHSGTAGTAGPPVVDFDVPNQGLSGCVDADAAMIESIRAMPSDYYVNVHNAEFGGGAVRGQLSAGM